MQSETLARWRKHTCRWGQESSVFLACFFQFPSLRCSILTEQFLWQNIIVYSIVFFLIPPVSFHITSPPCPSLLSLSITPNRCDETYSIYISIFIVAFVHISVFYVCQPITLIFIFSLVSF